MIAPHFFAKTNWHKSSHKFKQFHLAQLGTFLKENESRVTQGRLADLQLEEAHLKFTEFAY